MATNTRQTKDESPKQDAPKDEAPKQEPAAKSTPLPHLFVNGDNKEVHEAGWQMADGWTDAGEIILNQE